MNVILALEVAGDRCDLVSLNDEIRLQPRGCLAGLLGRSLIRISDCDERRHSLSPRWLLFCRQAMYAWPARVVDARNSPG
jgi:hypothetical protein